MIPGRAPAAAGLATCKVITETCPELISGWQVAVAFLFCGKQLTQTASKRLNPPAGNADRRPSKHVFKSGFLNPQTSSGQAPVKACPDVL